MTTPLAEKIKTIIRQSGPISVTDYFALCLADPDHGYYKTREPFGRSGDFVTAPEVSQLFGEMIGIFLVHAWEQHLRPAGPIRLVEIGPGRGTMMADILRTVAKLAPSLYETASVHLVETSNRLRSHQRQTLDAHAEKISWHNGFDDVPEGFLLLAANEFLDAVPIRQFVKTAQGFRERSVGLDSEGELTFAIGPGSIDPILLPLHHRDTPIGAIFEAAPAREAIMQAISGRLFQSGGTGLFIDYGHTEPDFGDTLQALKDHSYDPPLAHPGIADLTSHVDFASLTAAAKTAAVHVNGMMRQGDFLLGLGLAERAGQLGRGKDTTTQEAIRTAVTRLVDGGPGNMGALFKVLAISSPAVELTPFNTPQC